MSSSVYFFGMQPHLLLEVPEGWSTSESEQVETDLGVTADKLPKAHSTA